MTHFIEIPRLIKGKESLITISKNQIISIRPDADKTKITLTKMEYGSNTSMICPLSYNEFILKYEILK
jgi:hypothetical protein